MLSIYSHFRQYLFVALQLQRNSGFGAIIVSDILKSKLGLVLHGMRLLDKPYLIRCTECPSPSHTITSASQYPCFSVPRFAHALAHKQGAVSVFQSCHFVFLPFVQLVRSNLFGIRGKARQILSCRRMQRDKNFVLYYPTPVPSWCKGHLHFVERKVYSRVILTRETEYGYLDVKQCCRMNSNSGEYEFIRPWNCSGQSFVAQHDHDTCSELLVPAPQKRFLRMPTLKLQG